MTEPCRECPDGTKCPLLGIRVGPPQRRKCAADPEWREKFRRLGVAKAGAEKVAEAIDRARPAKVPRKPAPPRVRTAADLQCVHRGGVLETVGCRPCSSRGRDAAEVYECGVHGRCMIENFSTRKPGDNAVACSTCDDRAEPAIPRPA